MRIAALFAVLMVSCVFAEAQETLIARYVGYRYSETGNKSFITRELLFLKDKDTVRVNIRMPFDVNDPQISNPGVYYNCELKKNVVYTLTLTKKCIYDFATEVNSYYKTNAVADGNDCARFTEVVRNTEYRYTGNYGKYVDIRGILYEVTGLTPADGCNLPH